MAIEIKEKKDSTVLEDNQLLCVLTNQAKKISAKESNLQSVILMLNEEYGFDLDDMERDFTIVYTDPETDKSKKQKLELVVFAKGKEHVQENIIRMIVVQDDKVKSGDKKKG